jgi:protein-glutamine gamma-glutamyltransferase
VTELERAALRPRAEEGPVLFVAKALIATFGVCLFLLPLATPAGLLAGLGGTFGGYVLARLVQRFVRLPLAVGVGLVAIAAAHFSNQWVLDGLSGRDPLGAIWLADVLYFALGAFGVFFSVRLLSARARVFSVLEVALVVGAVAHTFADHRHQRIHQPRWLSDWAWSQGIDPAMVLEACGVAAIFLSVILLLRTRSVAKLLLTLLFLVLGAIATFSIAKNARFASDPDMSALGLGKDGEKNQKDKDDGGGGGGSGGRPPLPVAVALLHDELPDADVVYFRQTVLSRFAVDRLTRDTSGAFDRDVFSAFPGSDPLRVESPQNPALHRQVETSMFLLVDHAQYPGLGHPLEMRPKPNPDPRRFVAAYDVTSAFLHQELGRLVGRPSIPADWSDADKQHYLEGPSDPRYLELSNRIVRDLDPRFVGDDLMKALSIKRYLEKNGFYSLQVKTLVGADPTGKFLFGEMKGYCVHFAHSAVLLFRSQGIPARVALGYAVSIRRRGSGSSVLIYGNEAHAWPEIYLDGVGWVTFDIYPEKSDEPPSTPIDQDLENLLGELARNDKTGGKAEEPGQGLVIPWTELGLGAAAFLLLLLLVAYAIKGGRRARRSTPRLVYRGALDRLGDFGLYRQFGETRERHAARVAHLAPSFVRLTAEHLRTTLGGRAPDLATLQALAGQLAVELGKNAKRGRKILSALNPVGWWFTR